MSDSFVRHGADVDGDSTPFGVMRWLLDGEKVAEAAMTLGEVTIVAGRKNDLHVHDNAEEVLYLIEGELDHRVGDATYRLGPGDCIRVPAGVAHDASSVGAGPARMVVCYNHPHRSYRAVEAE